MDWPKERIKLATIGVREATYEVIPATEYEISIKLAKPEMFKFRAISIGDEKGQMFFVPLDESSLGTAEYILRAIAAYNGD